MNIRTSYYFFLMIAFMLNSCSKTNIDSPDTADKIVLDSLTPGLVFIGSDDGFLYALDLDKGSKVWSVQTGAAISTSPYAHTRYFHNGSIASSLVVVGNEDGSVNSFNGFTGQPGWSYKTGGPILVDPVITDDAVLVKSEDGHLYSLNEETGQLQWSALVNGSVGPAMIVYQQTIYCSSKDGNLYAINKTDGSTRWATKPGAGVSSGPALYFNDLAYESHLSDSIDVGVGTLDANYYKINATTGEITYNSINMNRVVVNVPVVYDNADTYAVDSSGELIYIDQVLDIESLSPYGIGRSSPTLVNRLLYFGDNQGLLYRNGTDAPGQGGVGFSTGRAIESSPVVSNGIVYLGSDDQKVYAINFDSKSAENLQWSFQTGGKVRSSPCVMDKMGIIYHPYFSGHQ
jgi:outer membrane protein assembly factor BamB